jgi:hypothetical protein
MPASCHNNIILCCDDSFFSAFLNLPIATFHQQLHTLKMKNLARDHDCIPSLPSSSSQKIDSSPSAIARVMAAMPTTSRTVSSIKPFLLGFVVAFMLLGIAALSSIHALCSDYNPIDVHLSTISKGDGITANPRTSVCHSSHTPVTEYEIEKTGELKRNERRLEWRETVPFLSLHIPIQKKKARGRKKEYPSINNNEEIVLPPQLDPRSCLCHLISEPFGYMKSQNSHTEDVIEGKYSLTSKEPFQEQLQATKRFPTAFTPEIVELSQQQERLVLKMGSDVLESVSDFKQRSSLVPWGGPPAAAAVEAVSFDWYARKKAHRGPSAPLEKIEGGNLFSSYLRIMKWPENLGETNFPFKLCKAKKKNEGKGCDSTVAIQHTLEFRERYKPWLVTPGIKRANANGLVYIRGFSPSYSDDEDGGHAIVWLRLALKVKTDDENDRVFFVRSMIREFDRAVAASLQRSNGRLGKFNAVVDGKDFTWNSMPSLGAVKALVAVLQDHFADRLGVIILVNVGSICEILLKLFLPLITEDVRNKIIMLPHYPKERLEALKDILGTEQNIPIGLGGTDNYDFDSDDYYANDVFGRDEEALEYLTTMPYHL